MEDMLQLPHKMTLNQRESLAMTGVTEVVSFDENAIILKTSLGDLLVQGQALCLKTLSLDGGEVSITGHIRSLVYEEPRPTGFWRRLLG